MSSIVLELQNEITIQNCDIVNILRRSHVIAIKLGLADFDKWITDELNGYSDQNTIPDYRKVRGVLKAFNPYNGWIPTLIQDADFERMICEKKISNSVTEIITLCEASENGLMSEFTGDQLALFNKMFDSPLPMRYALHIPTTAVYDIVEKVKNTILEWTLKLESEGIIGENMTFTDIEKANAHSMPQTVNHYYGNTSIINSPTDAVQIVSGNNNNVTFSYGQAKTDIAEIEKSIASSNLSEEDSETAVELLNEIKSKVDNEKNPHIIKSALVGLKDFMINAGAGVAAGLIQAKIQGLF